MVTVVLYPIIGGKAVTADRKNKRTQPPGRFLQPSATGRRATKIRCEKTRNKIISTSTTSPTTADITFCRGVMLFPSFTSLFVIEMLHCIIRCASGRCWSVLARPREYGVERRRIPGGWVSPKRSLGPFERAQGGRGSWWDGDIGEGSIDGDGGRASACAIVGGGSTGMVAS
ncbi:hypothetical protein RRF57_005835 [Xylaria bambusicola]|uniref:Uncharacterized protein n=1 Tax=Xylaria bambusicola TaxID=326684 RepID=A0AAN7UDA4_9PEZI